MTNQANSMINSVMKTQCDLNPFTKVLSPQQQAHSAEARNLSHCQGDFPQYQVVNQPQRTIHLRQRHQGKNPLQIKRQTAIQGSPKQKSLLQQLQQVIGGPTGPVYPPQVKMHRVQTPLQEGGAPQLNCQHPLQITKATEGLFSPHLLRRSKVGEPVLLKRVPVMLNSIK